MKLIVTIGGGMGGGAYKFTGCHNIKIDGSVITCKGFELPSISHEHKLRLKTLDSENAVFEDIDYESYNNKERIHKTINVKAKKIIACGSWFIQDDDGYSDHVIEKLEEINKAYEKPRR